MKAHILFCLLPFWAYTLQAQTNLQSWMEAGILSKMKYQAVAELSTVLPAAEGKTYRKLIATFDKDATACTLFLPGLVEEGKTAVVGQIASRLNREVYHIQTTRLQGKYIGETEKNLMALFRTAESKQWILFFDEADALFGRRTHLSKSDAHLSGMLLNGLKQFQGLSIIATQEKLTPQSLSAKLPCIRTPGDR